MQKFWLIWLNLRQSPRTPLRGRSQSESGLTLMESIVVIAIISIMAALTTPPLILAMASRIQARRAEMAMDIAQKEIERVRLLVDRGEYTRVNLPDVGENDSGTTITDIQELPNVAPPNRIVGIPICGVPIQNPCQTGGPQHDRAWWSPSREFFIQAFRDPGVDLNPPTGAPVAFRMGVRVYSKAAAEDINQLQTQIAPLYLSSGAGERAKVRHNGTFITAKNRQFPLAVVYADMVRGDLVGTLERYRQLVE